LTDGAHLRAPGEFVVFFSLNCSLRRGDPKVSFGLAAALSRFDIRSADRIIRCEK
jgi:hypothetical protein